MGRFVLILGLLSALSIGARAEQQRATQPAIRGRAGAIPLLTLDGRPVMLSHYGAPVTVLAFWATWCKPCLEELGYLEQLCRAGFSTTRLP